MSPFEIAEVSVTNIFWKADIGYKEYLLEEDTVVKNVFFPLQWQVALTALVCQQADTWRWGDQKWKMPGKIIPSMAVKWSWHCCIVTQSWRQSQIEISTYRKKKNDNVLIMSSVQPFLYLLGFPKGEPKGRAGLRQPAHVRGFLRLEADEVCMSSLYPGENGAREAGCRKPLGGWGRL